MKILITGAAGFIGYHTCLKLCHENILINGGVSFVGSSCKKAS